MTKHFCDVCGQELDSNRDEFTAFYGERYEIIKKYPKNGATKIEISVHVMKAKDRSTEDSVYLEICPVCILDLVTKITSAKEKK